MTPPPSRERRRVLPGLPLALSITVAGTGLFVVVPLAIVLATAAHLSLARYIAVALNPRALSAYRLSLVTSLTATALATALGLLLAWVVTRYTFPGRRLLDALIDLPVTLPTAILGIALTTLGAPIAYTPAGITLALTTLGLPFVVRALIPLLAIQETEEASAVLGATRWQTFTRVTLPTITPALLTGAGLTLARAVGEYGSVVFIAGNMPFRTEVAPLLIMTRIEEFDDGAATAIAATLLALPLLLLVAISHLERWASPCLPTPHAAAPPTTRRSSERR
jgi:sulfate/thiosulfate transport system permease protein